MEEARQELAKTVGADPEAVALVPYWYVKLFGHRASRDEVYGLAALLQGHADGHRLQVAAEAIARGLRTDAEEVIHWLRTLGPISTAAQVGRVELEVRAPWAAIDIVATPDGISVYIFAEGPTTAVGDAHIGLVRDVVWEIREVAWKVFTNALGELEE